MKIYRYWATEKSKMLFGQEEKEIKCYGGSNRSEAEARERAREKLAKVMSKIAGDRHAFDSYAVEIREEILREIDPKAIITRNRYGAQVLNVQDLMIMDIDKPRPSFWDLFGKSKDAKTKMVEMVRKLAKQGSYQADGFRIYETCKGIRVIVLGRTFDAKAADTQHMLQAFHCDALYSLMCARQDCFRARLTPKPGRLKLAGYKVPFPRSAEEEAGFRAWLAAYEAASRSYSVCKFIEQVGPGSVSETVRLHDEVTGAHGSRQLA